MSLSGESRTPRDGEVGILTLSSVANGRFAADKCKAVPADAQAGLGKPVKAGTLLMSRSNTIELVGSTALVEEDHPDRFLPDLLWAITLREDSPVDAGFLADYLSTSGGRALLQSAAMGTSGSMKKLSMARVRALKVPEVSATLRPRWTRIRRVFNALADQLTREIAAKRALKRGLLQELMTGRRRFPEFVNRERSWQSLGETVRRVTVAWSAHGSGDSARCVELEHIEAATGRLLGESTATIASSTKTAFRQGDVLLGKLRPYLRKFVAPKFGGVCSTEIWVLRAESTSVVPAFLHLLVQTDAVQSAMHLTAGSKMPRADWDVVAQAVVWVPETDEQMRITGLFDTLEREILLLEQQRQAYDSQKRALMEGMLAGEIIAPELAAQTPEPAYA